MLLASETCLDNTFSGLMGRSDHKTVTDICVSVMVMWLTVLCPSSWCSLIHRQEDTARHRSSENSLNHQLPSVTVLNSTVDWNIRLPMSPQRPWPYSHLGLSSLLLRLQVTILLVTWEGMPQLTLFFPSFYSFFLMWSLFSWSLTTNHFLYYSFILNWSKHVIFLNNFNRIKIMIIQVIFFYPVFLDFRVSASGNHAVVLILYKKIYFIIVEL